MDPPSHLFLITFKIYLFLAALDLRCLAGFFSSCGVLGLLFCCRAQALGHTGFSSCGTWSQYQAACSSMVLHAVPPCALLVLRASVLLLKEPTCSAGASGDSGLITGLGRSPGGGHGNQLQYSCLGNPMERGAWWATVHGVTKSQT